MNEYILSLYPTFSVILFSLMNALLGWLFLGSLNQYFPECKVDGKNYQLRKKIFTLVLTVSQDTGYQRIKLFKPSC